MQHQTKQNILSEFKGFKPPPSFAGGCKKTREDGFCVHMRPDGSVGKIEQNCRSYVNCDGFNYKFNP